MVRVWWRHALVWLAAACLVLLAGCAPNAIHRSRMAQATADAAVTPESLKAFAGDCHWRVGQPNPYAVGGPGCSTHSVESSDQHALFFVEFDEQGRMYDDRQFDQLFSYLDGRVNCGADLSIVVFVHGWRHNAQHDDGNVALAREVLTFTFQGERAGRHPNQLRNRTGEAEAASTTPCVGAPADQQAREVVGIYVGWRGKSMDGGRNALLQNWELPSVFDRKNVAQSVAIGSVRELFSRLRVFQYRVNGNENLCDQGAEPFQCKRVRMLIVGHSFGGLLVFNAVSPSIMDSLNAGAGVRTDAPGACLEAPEELGPGERPAPRGARPAGAEQRSALVRSFADLIVLINPAIEGVRFEPLHQALQRRMRSRDNPICPNQKPVLVVVTADNDYATRYAFRAVRAFSTLLEDDSPQGLVHEDAADKLAMRRREEQQSSINTMGHVERFQTHDLVGVERLLQQAAEPGAAGPALPALQAYCAAPAADALDGALKACRCGPRRWLGYVAESVAAGRYNCPAYVEELNTAEAMTGTFSALLPSAGAGLAEGQSLYQTERWRQAYCGGAVLAQRGPFQARDERGEVIAKPWAGTRVIPNSPIWMVKSYDKGIVNNHSGIETMPLKLFIRQVYHDISIMNFDRRSFDRLNLDANRDFRAECSQPLAEPKAGTP